MTDTPREENGIVVCRRRWNATLQQMVFEPLEGLPSPAEPMTPLTMTAEYEADARRRLAKGFAMAADEMDGAFDIALSFKDEIDALRSRLSAEEAAHSTIASICFAEGAESADGTSIAAVRSLAALVRLSVPASPEAEMPVLKDGCPRWLTVSEKVGKDDWITEEAARDNVTRYGGKMCRIGVVEEIVLSPPEPQVLTGVSGLQYCQRENDIGMRWGNGEWKPGAGAPSSWWSFNHGAMTPHIWQCIARDIAASDAIRDLLRGPLGGGK